MIEHLHDAAARPSRVVILGGNGFLGRHLTARLRESGIAAVPLSSRDVDLTEAGSVETLAGILKSDDALVFASCITPDRGKDIAAAMKNLTMGQNAAAAIEDAPCDHLIYISSDAVYADNVELAHEQARCEPSSLYGLGHFGRERMMEHVAKAKGIPLLILRPSLLYGPDDTHNSYGPNRFARTALDGGKIELFGGGEEKRDHIYIGDVARLIEQCLLRKSAGILNIATGGSAAFIDIARQVAELTPGEVEIICHERRMPITHRHYDIAATIKALPEFRYTPLAEGLARSRPAGVKKDKAAA